MTKEIAKHQIDPAKLPPLTRQQKAELAALAAMPDKQIDTSDITPLTEQFWKTAIRNPFYPPWPGDPRVNIQNAKGEAKPYQVKQVLQAINKLDGKP